MYLTAQRFREMGLGTDLSNTEDAELTSLLARASSVVDSYCNAPRIPQKHDFKGGTITGEQHRWRYPTNPFEVGQRKYYPYHWPIISVEEFRIYVTNTQFVEIGIDSLLINNSERYWEVVSLALTSSGLFNALIIPNVGLAEPLATASYTYGWDFLVTDEGLTCSDGQTWRAQNQFWFTDLERAPIIKKNGVVETSGFTVDAIEGTVVFDDNLLATDTVTATYHHKLPADIQFGTGHIALYLQSQAEVYAKGMGQLTRLRVAEVDIERRDVPTLHRFDQTLANILDTLVPEASLLLGSYRADHMTVR